MVEADGEEGAEPTRTPRLREQFDELNSGRFDGVWLCVLVIIAALAPPLFEKLVR